MRITLKAFAMLTDHLPPAAHGSNALEAEVPDGATVWEVIDRFNLPRKMCHLVLVDGHFVPADQRETRALREGETLAIWPPVAGG